MASKKKWKQKYRDAVQDGVNGWLKAQELETRIREKDGVIEWRSADCDAYKKDIDRLRGVIEDMEEERNCLRTKAADYDSAKATFDMREIELGMVNKKHEELKQENDGLNLCIHKLRKVIDALQDEITLLKKEESNDQ